MPVGSFIGKGNAVVPLLWVLNSLALLGAWPTHCAEINIGGVLGWRPGVDYDAVNAAVGDILVFKHRRGRHRVVRVPQRECNENSTGVKIDPVPSHPDTTSLPLEAPGVFYFRAPAIHMCKDGMLITVNVTAGVEGVRGRRRHPSPARLRHQMKGPDGWCTSPEAQPAPAPPHTWTITCFTARWRLRPGEVVTSFRRLPSAYPGGRLVALMGQRAHMVDEHHRPVPQSVLFVRQFFSDTRFVLGVGTDIRSCLPTKPLPHPYAIIVNTSVFADPNLRFAKISIINTVSVRADSMQRCLECWCPDPALGFEPHTPGRPGPYRTLLTEPHTVPGGFDTGRTLHTHEEAAKKVPARLGAASCCSRANCQMDEDVPRIASLFHLQLNVTFRILANESDGNLVPVHQHLLDAAGGAMEYDVILSNKSVSPDGRGAVHLQYAQGAIDGRCPQMSAFKLVRCIAHQHPGGACVQLQDVESGKLICQSCPVYGTGPVDEAGNESGYIVRMVPEDLNPVYRFSPGQQVRLTSIYNASPSRYGVMGLLVLYLADWDLTCPGRTGESRTPFGPTHDFARGTDFGFAHPDGAF